MFPAGNRKIKVNMNYQKIYNDLIFKRKVLQPLDVIHVFGIGRGNVGKYDGNYTETHHIVLKACGGSNDSTNLVVLRINYYSIYILEQNMKMLLQMHFCE